MTVDLEQAESIGRVTVHAYSVSNSYEKYRVEVSADGQTFESVGSQQQRPEQAQRSEPQAAAMVDYRFPPREVRFIRVVSSGNHGYVFDSFSKLVEIQAYPD